MDKAKKRHSYIPLMHEALHKLSKEELIDLVFLLEEQVAEFREENRRLTARMEELERRLRLNSQNSSKPPSSDPPHIKRPKKRSRDRKPGGQPGHEGHFRKLLSVEEVNEAIPVKPFTCGNCGRWIDGEDPAPRRHQVWDFPVVRPKVTEYQLHKLLCEHCGEYTVAELPEGVPSGAFGPRLQAIVSICTGVYHMSRRTVEGMMEDIFHIPISLGSISACESAVSYALAEPVEEAREQVQGQEVLHADETGWREGNKRAWLWVAVTGAATVFMIHAQRSQEAAKELLGRFAGVLVSDRWSAYNVYKGLRQLCWAHLKRDFEGFCEYNGKAGKIGERLLSKAELIFHWWHRVRDGTLTRRKFKGYMKPLRVEVEDLFREGMVCGHEKMERSCKRILKHAPALWTFVDVKGVELTNNAAERAVRSGVLWRKCSFGTQSSGGSRFAERIMTATATCKQQGRNVVEYITEACHEFLHSRPAPSLLPEATEILAQTA